MPMKKRSKYLTARDHFILDKAKDFTPQEIVILLGREGFEPVSRMRVYQLLKKYNVEPISTRVRQ